MSSMSNIGDFNFRDFFNSHTNPSNYPTSKESVAALITIQQPNQHQQHDVGKQQDYMQQHQQQPQQQQQSMQQVKLIAQTEQQNFAEQQIQQFHLQKQVIQPQLQQHQQEPLSIEIPQQVSDDSSDSTFQHFKKNNYNQTLLTQNFYNINKFYYQQQTLHPQHQLPQTLQPQQIPQQSPQQTLKQQSQQPAHFVQQHYEQQITKLLQQQQQLQLQQHQQHQQQLLQLLQQQQPLTPQLQYYNSNSFPAFQHNQRNFNNIGQTSQFSQSSLQTIPIQPTNQTLFSKQENPQLSFCFNQQNQQKYEEKDIPTKPRKRNREIIRTENVYRKTYSRKTKDQLEVFYSEDKFLNPSRREFIMKETGLSKQQVNVWYQNRRAKEKKDRKLE